MDFFKPSAFLRLVGGIMFVIPGCSFALFRNQSTSRVVVSTSLTAVVLWSYLNGDVFNSLGVVSSCQTILDPVVLCLSLSVFPNFSRT